MRRMEKIKKLFWRIVFFNQPVKYARKKGVSLGNGNSFVDHPNFGSEPYLISIGDNNRISFECAFITHDGGRWTLDHLFHDEKPFIKFGTIRIGSNNFIGARTVVNPGITIGDNCVIAAGSIVTKSIPTGEVWGGVPARRIMSIEEYRDKLINNKKFYNLYELEKNKRNELIRVLMHE